jgi:hypothetical protein
VTNEGARLLTVRSFEVDDWWPHVSHHIGRWLDFDESWTAEGVKEEIKEARAQLWCMHSDAEGIIGIWVTRIHVTDSVSIGHVWGCAGDFGPYKDDAVALFGNIEDWFRDMGCKFVDWTGRDGWMKIFPDYKRHAVVLRKRL